ASNVSLMCIGWQTVLDAILCIAHIFLCLVMQPLFTAFASVAFFKLLIFCVIEMKYMALIIQARNNTNNPGHTQDDLRRQITMLHFRFYAAMFFILVLYSFWIPQIVLNIITESRKPMHPYYIYGMSFTRLVAPLYVFAVQKNFLKEVNPDPNMCKMLFVWVIIQTAVLIGQGKFGTRFMIPQRFLPPKFDYSQVVVPDAPTLDCVICYNEIDVNDRAGYMLAPCDHIFHRQCLEQWMEVKMECPICRCNLP
ncbi:hypothetical protein THAPSDRAFT_261916, partial [Thalassiosira pseudonana CCMP1335]